MSRSPRRAGVERGFTLIELMITVAIVAILAAIAIPSYRDSVWKGKRAEAKAAMLKALQAEERFFSQNNTYAKYSTTTDVPSASFPLFSADTAANSRYSIKVEQTGVTGACTDNDLTKCAIVVATVIGAADPNCGTMLAIDTVGNKTSGINNALCWK